MNIAILGLTATSYGSLTYLQNFLPELARLDCVNRYDVFLPSEQVPTLSLDQLNFWFHTPRSAPKSGAWRVLWEQLVMPWILRERQADMVYTTQNLAVLLSPVPSIIIVQNVEPFFLGEFPNPLPLRARLWLLRLLTALSLRRSHAIIAISDWEKEFLQERFHLPGEKILVCHPGVTPGFGPAAPESAEVLRKQLGIAPPFLISATRLSGYGNLLNLARAYVSLVKAGKVTMPLVVPGEVWDRRYIGEVQALLRREGCLDQVKFLGYVPHAQMPLLFGHATCFIFPSLLEACGTVLIEALACGTPILCCRRRPMMDICGEAAVLFDGEDPDDIAAKLHQVLSDPTLRQLLARAGLERCQQFSWRRGTRKVYGIFQQFDSADRTKPDRLPQVPAS